MPVVFHTGFEHGEIGALLPDDPTNNTPPVSDLISTTTPNSGTYCRRYTVDANDDYCGSHGYDHLAADTVTFGCAVRASSLTDMAGIHFRISTKAGTTYWAAVEAEIQPNGSVDLSTGYFTNPYANGLTSRSVKGSTAVGQIVDGEWAYIEVHALIKNSGGSAAVSINGVEVLTFSGDTNGSPSGETDGQAFGSVYFYTDGTSGNRTVDIDDLYIATGLSGPLGPQVHEALTPTSAIENGGTGSDANSVDNHLLVDDVPFSQTDYVELDAALETERYGFSDRTDTGTVNAVTIRAGVLNPNGGVVDSNLILESNTTESDGDPIVLSSTQSVREAGPFVTDPNTAVAWTNGGVNALTAGIEINTLGVQ